MRPASIDKNGTQALAAGEHAVAHGLVDRGWALGGRGQQTLQCGISKRLALLQSLVEHAGEYNKGVGASSCSRLEVAFALKRRAVEGPRS